MLRAARDLSTLGGNSLKEHCSVLVMRVLGNEPAGNGCGENGPAQHLRPANLRVDISD